MNLISIDIEYSFIIVKACAVKRLECSFKYMPGEIHSNKIFNAIPITFLNILENQKAPENNVVKNYRSTILGTIMYLTMVHFSCF